MGDKIKLFDESDQDEQDDVEFRTNKGYAKHYDEFRKKEILGQLKNLNEEIGSSDSSDDETTDDEIVDPDFDKEFFRTLAFLKRKDKEKYKEQQTFFENVKPIEEVALTKRHHKEKPMTVKDYERKVMLEKGGVFEDDEDIGKPIERSASPTIVEEERKIKDEIKQALSKIGDDESEDEDEGKGKGGGLLLERKKSESDTAKEQSDYIQWLADKKAKEPPSEEVKVLEPLKHFWSNEKLSKEDAFLKDYILNKRFVQSSGEVPTYDEIVATSEDEEELDRQDNYERQYNFRFEEPDAEYIKQYPRMVEDSVRVERNKRKENRHAVKERKQKEKEQQRRELEELKAIKLKEIREKIQRLKEIAATENLAMDVDDLESEFDPDEHDRRMKQMFDDEYYGVDEGDQKPEFPDLDQELGIENYDVDRLEVGDDDDAGPHCEDDDFVMDCDYEEKLQSGQSVKEAHQQELLESTRKGKKKGRRQSKFREVLKAEKPLFDPEDEKTYGEYIDEYYKLDYEDMIGDTPCRFKYVETVPNDFGLTVEEILGANTSELNKWASVKKTLQLRPKNVELNEIQMYRRKGASETMKRRILPSLYTMEEDEVEDEEIQKRKKNAPETNREKNDDDESIHKTEKKIKKNAQQNNMLIEETSNAKEKKKKGKKDKVSKSEDIKSEAIVEKAEANGIIETNVDESTAKTKKKSKSEKLAKSENENNTTTNVESVATAQDSETTINQESTPAKKKKNHQIKEENSAQSVNKSTSSCKDVKTVEKSLKKAHNASTDGHNKQQKHFSNPQQKRKLDNTGDKNTNGHWNGPKKARFGRNEHQNGFGGGRGVHQKRDSRAGGPKRGENAADQRLRAFGLNPTKFHNKQIYGKQAQQYNGENPGFKNASLNKAKKID
uniref:Protein KRI1 homolog n=1 Tax=Anopheles christyi TaxID=43041 RepID=A0A182K0Y1_9DIPT